MSSHHRFAYTQYLHPICNFYYKLQLCAHCFHSPSPKCTWITTVQWEILEGTKFTIKQILIPRNRWHHKMTIVVLNVSLLAIVSEFWALSPSRTVFGIVPSYLGPVFRGIVSVSIANHITLPVNLCSFARDKCACLFACFVSSVECDTSTQAYPSADTSAGLGILYM